MATTAKIDTVMFLFRDLITDPTMTIQQHVEKIHTHGTCWWGWWKKAIEDVPADIMERVLQKGPADIFLFDSGLHEIYQATMDKVEIAPSDEPIHSPDIERTPDYYVDVRLLTWLRLTRIALVRDKDTLFKELSYAGFPSWPKRLYDEYVGRPIRGTEELDAMIVTMWHLRITEEFAPLVTEL